MGKILLKRQTYIFFLFSFNTFSSVHLGELKNINPNPFNSSFNIDLNVEKDNTDISMQLFSITGTEVISKSIRHLNKGDHNILIDMNDGVASGSYILRINSDQNSLSRKLLYLK